MKRRPAKALVFFTKIIEQNILWREYYFYIFVITKQYKMSIKKKKTEKTHFSRVIRLEKSVNDALKGFADAEKRSLKNYIELKLTQIATEGNASI